jgi:predicted AAA+ superfamily ATPase
MVLKSVLREVIESQLDFLEHQELGTERLKTGFLVKAESHITVVAGIRRCGKSTMLRQIMNKKPDVPKIFINFEDARLSNFDVADFQKLLEVVNENYPHAECYFDEIQNVNEWERLIRPLHDAGKCIYITGSNASLLSSELGTRLTGRYLLSRLYPFSYSEFLHFFQTEAGNKSFEEYLFLGGFPDYLKSKNPEILHQLFNDILVRDISVRYGVKDQRLLQQLGVYMLSNAGKEFSYHSLRKTFQIGSVNTVVNYINYFENSFLLFQVPLMSWSLKKQIANPKKIYVCDNGLIKNISLSFSEDRGRLLENIVFMMLKNAGKEIYYFRETNECDFVYKDGNKFQGAIQVCFQLTTENFERESKGLLDAMEILNFSEGYILTMDETDCFVFDDKTIYVKPVWKWYLENLSGNYYF